jgi:hypothetical protein
MVAKGGSHHFDGRLALPWPLWLVVLLDVDAICSLSTKDEKGEDADE